MDQLECVQQFGEKDDLGNLITDFKYLSNIVRKGNRLALCRSRERLGPARTFCREVDCGSKVGGRDFTMVPLPTIVQCAAAQPLRGWLGQTKRI